MNKIILSLAAAAFAAAGFSQTFYASTDKFGYTGTMSKYDTLSDAQNSVNSVGDYVFDQRDGGLFVTQNANDWSPGFENSNIFLTAWYYTTDATHGAYSGWGNPNNTNTGFAQLYDADGNTSTVKSGGWTSNAYDTFHMNVQGANAGAADSARLWHGGIGGASAVTAGTFLNYELDMTFTGLNGVEIAPGFYESNGHQSSTTGYFRGIFQNTNTNTTSYNGFYVYDLSFNDLNWAYDNSADLNGAFSDSTFGASAVPEPASMAVLGLGAASLLRRRRNAKK